MSEEKDGGCGCSGCLSSLLFIAFIFVAVPTISSMLSRAPAAIESLISGSESHDTPEEAEYEPDGPVETEYESEYDVTSYDEGPEEAEASPLLGTVEDEGHIDLEDAEPQDGNGSSTYQVIEGYTLIEGSYGSSQFAESFYEAVSSFSEKICVKNIPEEAVHTLFGDSVYECFWVKSYTGKTVTVTSHEQKDFYAYYDISYYDDERYALEDMKAALESTINQILSQVSGDTPFECALEVHDILVDLVTYDKTGSLPHVHDLYGALVNHVAVCDGYSHAFSYLMWRLGYKSETVISDSHAWNVMEGTYSDERFLDVTWDDLDTYDIYGRPYISHDHLFLTEEEMEAIGQHTLLRPAERKDDRSFDQRYNYHYVYGYYLDGFNLDQLAAIFQHQLQELGNYLTVRFANWNDYQQAYGFITNGSEERDAFVSGLGYTGPVSIIHDDVLMIISIELYTTR